MQTHAWTQPFMVLLIYLKIENTLYFIKVKMIKKHFFFFLIKYTLKQNRLACRQKKILQFQSDKTYFTPSLYERCLKNSLPLWMISIWKINENEECLPWWIVTAPFTSSKLWQLSSEKKDMDQRLTAVLLHFSARKEIQYKSNP